MLGARIRLSMATPELQALRNGIEFARKLPLTGNHESPVDRVEPDRCAANGEMALPRTRSELRTDLFDRDLGEGARQQPGENTLLKPPRAVNYDAATTAAQAGPRWQRHGQSEATLATRSAVSQSSNQVGGPRAASGACRQELRPRHRTDPRDTLQTARCGGMLFSEKSTVAHNVSTHDGPKATNDACA